MASSSSSSSSSATTVRVVLLFSLVLCALLAKSSEGVVVRSRLTCNGASFRGGVGASEVVEGVLEDLRRRTPTTKGFNLSNQSPRSATVKVFGRAKCSKNISMARCKNCLENAFKFIKPCVDREALGGLLTTTPNLCFMEYEDHKF